MTIAMLCKYITSEAHNTVTLLLQTKTRSAIHIRLETHLTKKERGWCLKFCNNNEQYLCIYKTKDTVNPQDIKYSQEKRFVGSSRICYIMVHHSYVAQAMRRVLLVAYTVTNVTALSLL